MFYLGLIKFKNGTKIELSASSEEMLDAKVGVMVEGIQYKVEKVDIYKAEKVKEINY